MQHLNCLTITIALAAVFSTGAEAQNINQPTHIPNQFQNKINHVRLQGIIERENASDTVRDTQNQHLDTDKFGFNRRIFFFSPQEGCNINIGNSASNGVGSATPTNVIVAGDVINHCK